MRGSRLSLLGVVVSLLLLGGCSSLRKGGGRVPVIKLESVPFHALTDWQQDHDIPHALKAFKISCKVLLKKKPTEPLGLGTYAGDWHPVCRQALECSDSASPQETRAFFEAHFVPYRVTDNGDPEGLFTGYYESSLNGSRQKTPKFWYPLYKKPPELLLSQDKEKKWGVLSWGKIVPYYDRAAIDKGALEGKGLELVWVDDPVEAFFLHIQGSGRVTLPDGQVMRVNYAASNGHPFFSIGRELVHNNIMDTKDVSMQSIRGWMARFPDQARVLMHKNPSYIFFREVENKGDGPIGCMGVPLTPLRSMAIDRRWLPMGCPLWFDGRHPDNYIQERRLMIAQDTGGAIRGAVRGDFFWGFGKDAMERAGKMKSKGQYYVLLPKRVSVPRSYLLKNK
ncbi:MAG: murein transglycosylase A [Alphaproteobacteria bacterium]